MFQMKCKQLGNIKIRENVYVAGEEAIGIFQYGFGFQQTASGFQYFIPLIADLNAAAPSIGLLDGCFNLIGKMMHIHHHVGDAVLL